MTIKQRFFIFIALGVQLFGHVRCSPDKSITHPTTAWSIGDMRFVRGELEQKTIPEAQKEFPHFFLDDQIVFTDLESNASGIQIQIQSDCFLDKNKISQHSFQEKLKSGYYFYELLPLSVYSNFSITEQIYPTCQFRFIITNSRGDTHRFQIDPIPIQIYSEKTIPIRHANKPLRRRVNAQLAYVYEREWPLYTVESPPDTTLHMLCEFHKAEYKSSGGATLLANFNLIERADITDRELIRPIERCRILASVANNRVRALTDEFLFQKDIASPNIRALTNPAPIYEYNKEFVFRQYEIHNPTGQNMVLATPKQFPAALKIEMYARQNMREQYVIPGLMSLLTSVSGGQIIDHPTEWRWVLAPYTTSYMTVYRPIPKFTCQRPFSVFGFYFQTDFLFSFWLNQIHKANGESGLENLAQEMTLETVITRQYGAYVEGPPAVIPSPSYKPPVRKPTVAPGPGIPHPSLCTVQ